MKHSHIPVPETMQDLQLTEKGYLKPWFVKGDDFRVVDLKKAAFAVTKKACWICGKPFFRQEYAMVCSPESAQQLAFKEPPCHPDCAVYAVQVCPFILYPAAKRRSAGLEKNARLENVNQKLDIPIAEENPGSFYIVIVDDFRFHQDRQLMTARESQVRDRQFWVGGLRQEPSPNPDVNVDRD